MSSRVLKKLHGDNELDIRDEDASDLDNDNSFVASSGARKKQYDGNRYDLVSCKLILLLLLLFSVCSIVSSSFWQICLLLTVRACLFVSVAHLCHSPIESVSSIHFNSM